MPKSTLDQALERINGGEFKLTYELHTKPLREMNVLERAKAHEIRKSFNEREAAMRQKVREMLAELYKVSEHKNEPKLWALAWEHGHNHGYAEVALNYDEFVQLIK